MQMTKHEQTQKIAEIVAQIHGCIRQCDQSLTALKAIVPMIPQSMDVTMDNMVVTGLNGAANWIEKACIAVNGLSEIRNDDIVSPTANQPPAKPALAATARPDATPPAVVAPAIAAPPAPTVAVPVEASKA